ncbi:MAG TPA: LLM class flavin-dependent oxidoreductase [Acidimicrobiia bacterium]|nr:LLM class flavin-dependent oxidoreductase [Acidimicrobiia bacterium]
MSLELAIQTMAGWATSLELARWAEAEEMAAFAVADHYLSTPHNRYALDQMGVLAAVAAKTSSIELATLVSPITFRHPAVMLKMAVTIDEISEGRFTLGLGAGWMKEEHEAFGLDFPSTRERFERLEEALAYVDTARRGDGGGFAGDYYRLAPGPPPEPSAARVRIAVGGSGPRRTPRLAGRYADEFNVFPSRDPIEARIAVAREAAEKAGRDPAELLISTAFPMVTGTDPADLENRIQRVATARRADADRIRTRWPQAGIPVATVDEYRDHMAQLEAIGIQRVYLQVAFDPVADIQRLLPLLR